MSLQLILSVLSALLKFPGELRAFLLFLEKAPEEKRQEMQENILKENDSFKDSGRPSWD